MSQIGSVYAQALYSLAEEESLAKTILDELMTLDGEYCKMFTLQASGYREEDDDEEE